MEHAARGKKAIDNSQYAQAVEHYSAALKQSPESPDYFINRAVAYQRTQKFEEALSDAEHAVVYAQKRAKREQIIDAQFRRGCALYSLGRYGDAEFVFGLVKRMDKDHKAVGMWINKTAMALQKFPEGDLQRHCSIVETPTLDKIEPIKDEKSALRQESLKTNQSGHPREATPVAAPVAPQQSRADQIRHDWYQNTQNIYFTLLAKGVPKESAQIDIKERSLSINFPLLTGSSYDLTLEPLFAPVKPTESTFRVLPSKIEIVLAKANPGQKWAHLEGSEAGNTTSNVPSAVQETSSQASSTGEGKAVAPAYPTSSKSGPKDWDKVVKDIRHAEKKSEDGAGEKDATGDDDDDDDVGGDPANHFFKKLFKGASPEMQRAMIKSYTESNGTALSTNWEEVSKGKVETSPPDGMEAKNWT